MSTKATFFSFKKPTDPVQAQEILTNLGILFYFAGMGLALLIAITGHIFAGILDGIFYLLLGYLLHKYQSRIAAMMAILFTFNVLLLTIHSYFIHEPGGRNIIIALLLFIYSLRAVQVSVNYHKFIRSKVIIKNLIVKTIFSLIYTSIIMIILLISAAFFLHVKKLEHLFIARLLVYSFFFAAMIATFFSFAGYSSFTRNKPICKRRTYFDGM